MIFFFMLSLHTACNTSTDRREWKHETLGHTEIQQMHKQFTVWHFFTAPKLVFAYTRKIHFIYLDTVNCSQEAEKEFRK